MKPEKNLATPQEVADYLGLTPNALAKLRMEEGAGPEFVRLGPRTIRYEWSAVLAWVEDNTHRSTDEFAA